MTCVHSAPLGHLTLNLHGLNKNDVRVDRLTAAVSSVVPVLSKVRHRLVWLSRPGLDLCARMWSVTHHFSGPVQHELPGVPG